MPQGVNYLSQPRLKRPVLIAGFPGIANVGKLAAEYLVHKLKAKKFVELYSEHFPEWVVQEEGLVKPLKVDFFYTKPPELKHDLILVTADAQAATPVGQYALTGEILDVADQHGVSTVVTVAAYVLSPNEVRSKAVLGAASDLGMTKMLEKNGVELLDGGMIVGMNGMLLGLAAVRGMQGFCLLGTTEGGLLDTAATAAVLQTLATVLGLDLDLRELQQHAEVFPKFRPPKIMLPEGAEEEPSYIR